MNLDLPKKGGCRNNRDDRRQEGRHERRRRARRRALQALYQWRITDQQAEDILHQFRHAQDLSQIDEPFFETLLRGVIAGHEDLDRRLQPFLDRPVEQVDVMEQTILRLGAWELLQRPEVPFRVVLNECIELAHRFGAEQGHAFVNGVLDKAAKAWRPAEADESLD
jgi:N utilization substance protein B